MYFYEIRANILKSELQNTQAINEDFNNEMNKAIAGITDDYYRENNGSTYTFVKSIHNNSIIFCLLSDICCDVKGEIIKYAKKLNLDVKITKILDCTWSNFKRLIDESECNDLINNSNYIYEEFNLENLRNTSDFKEFLIKENSKTQICKQARVNILRNSIVPELERINMATDKKLMGHPVHYLIQTDDLDCEMDAFNLILSSLYSVERIRSKRYSVVKFNLEQSWDWIEEYQLNALYQNSVNGTIIIKFLMDSLVENDDEVGKEHQAIELAAKYIKKFRHKVLTIICLPREATKLKEYVYDELGSISLVEFIEDNFDTENSKTYLNALAKRNKVKSDKKLLSKIVDGELYIAKELQDIFDEWYDQKIKNDAYPQYKEMETANKKIVNEPMGNNYDKLQKMIGLTEAKKVIDEALSYAKFRKLYKDQLGEDERPTMHMVFTGNPGTAKTSVARLVAAIFRENKILSNGHLVEVGRSELVGKYVGWTATIVKKKFEQAKGGVLFIDEAYSLVDDRKGSYGDEAINTIVQEMENHRDDVIVILAGYKKEMENFLNTNPGLRSRIAFHIPFEDYNADELTEIAKLMADNKKLRLSKGAIDKIHNISEKACITNSFGNGRYIRNLLERACMSQANRVIKMDENEINKKVLTTLEEEDFSEIMIEHVDKKVIGFY